MELGGDFRLLFEGESTGDIPVGASAARVEAALEELSTVTDVDIALTALPYNGMRITITFIGQVGDVPMLEATGGRLTGRATRAGVDEVVVGTPAVLAYDGRGQPNTVEVQATGLQTGSSYAFKVVAVSAVGRGVPSAASSTVVARAGSSAS